MRGIHTFFVTLACLPLEDFYTNDLSLLYHAATSQEAGQQQSISCTYCGWCHFVDVVIRKEV